MSVASAPALEQAILAVPLKAGYLEIASERLQFAPSSSPEKPGGQVTSDDARGRFSEVVMPHLDDAFRLARWLTNSHHDAEDVVQDAILRAYSGLAGFGGTNPRGW